MPGLRPFRDNVLDVPDGLTQTACDRWRARHAARSSPSTFNVFLVARAVNRRLMSTNDFVVGAQEPPAKITADVGTRWLADDGGRAAVARTLRFRFTPPRHGRPILGIRVRISTHEIFLPNLTTSVGDAESR
jgi:hypothetical protein